MDFAWCNSPNLFPKEIHQLSAFFNTQKILKNYDEGKYPIQLKNEFSLNRKAEYIAGRYCALKILKSLNIEVANILSNEDRSPIWPPNVLGSITHTKNYVSVSISTDSNLLGLGRDTEYIFPKTLVKKVGLSIVQKKEWKYINDFPDEKFITLLYSAKESLFKAIYPINKFFFDFNDVEIVGLDNKNFKIKPKIPLGPLFGAGQIFQGSYLLTDELVHTGVDIKKDEIK